jgi:aldehyde dehydrogenase (NAD+)
VINILNGSGATGALLASHMSIRMISFTGSAPTGRAVMALAANSNLKRVILELGGKAPAVIFEDADLDNAVRNCSENVLRVTGQICIATTRLLVHKSIAETFTARLKTAFEDAGKNIGADPLNPTTVIGPLADAKQLAHVLSGLEAGKASSTLLVGGSRKGTTGCFVLPTIFLDPPSSSSIYRDEVFGPVVMINTFETEAEAVAMANDTEYGLFAAVFTGNVGRAMRVARGIEAGVVVVNANSRGNGSNTAFGGMKGSGYGRIGGKYSLMSFLETKSIEINMMV